MWAPLAAASAQLVVVRAPLAAASERLVAVQVRLVVVRAPLAAASERLVAVPQHPAKLEMYFHNGNALFYPLNHC